MIGRKKKIVSALLAVVMIMLMSTMVSARWKNVSSMAVDLYIDNSGKATLSAAVDGYSGTTKITAVAVLERLNANGTYTEIERWNNISAENWYLDWTSTRYVAKGHTYRFTYTATVTRNGVSETVSTSISRAG